MSGTFSLHTRINNAPANVSGTFNNPGTITLLKNSQGDSFCTQTYKVTDGLMLLSPTGTGNFSATLTHYGYVAVGQCHVVFATVSGVVTLDF